MTISELGAEALRNYKYKGEDRSLLYKRVLSPLAEWMVRKTVPLWLAPNVITFAGLIFPVTSLFIFMYYCPTLVSTGEHDCVIPSWAFVFNAVALFAYQTLDNMDGKQARRTGTSNALGMIFDHGCDAVNAVVGAFNLAVTLGVHPGRSSFVLCLTLATPFVPFYVATWEEYYTGELILPIINGPSEGVALGVAVALISAMWGPSFWSTKREWTYPLPWVTNWGEVVAVMSFAGILLTVLYNIGNVLQRQYATRESLLRPLLDLSPFVVLCVGTGLVATRAPQLCSQHLPYVIGTVGAVFVESVVQLMLSHMTHTIYAPHKRWLLLPFALGVYVTCLSGGDSEQAALVWRYLFMGVGTYTLLFLLTLVMKLCLILDVRCFRIRKAKREDHGEDVQDGGKGKMATNGNTSH